RPFRNVNVEDYDTIPGELLTYFLGGTSAQVGALAIRNQHYHTVSLRPLIQDFLHRAERQTNHRAAHIRRHLFRPHKRGGKFKGREVFRDRHPMEHVTAEQSQTEGVALSIGGEVNESLNRLIRSGAVAELTGHAPRDVEHELYIREDARRFGNGQAL